MNAVWSLITGVANAVLAVFTGGALRIPFHTQTHTKEFSVEVVRPDDLVVLTLDFYNIRRQGSGAGPLQVDRVAAGDGFVVAHFPPQSFAERAFFEEETGVPPSDPPSIPPVPSRIAGPSQLIFRVAPELLPFAFNLKTILDVLTNCDQVTWDITQRPPAIPAVGARAIFGGYRSHFSAIEAPYRLFLSPDVDSRWSHAGAPVRDAANKFTELWHTRLSPGATAAAVWSPDYIESNNSPPASPPAVDVAFRMSLQPKDRHEIVRSTSEPGVSSKPVEVLQMMLTSQGAWLDVHGRWDPPLSGTDLVDWKHILTGGRDQFAKIVRAGFMHCLGHRAVFIKTTQRKVQRGSSGNVIDQPIAYLRQRVRIFIREETKTYQHRKFPFRSITFKTLATPYLDDPVASQINGLGEAAFWPKVNGQDVLFHVTATDWLGKEREYHIPLAFVLKTLSENRTQIDQVTAAFEATAITDDRRKRPLHGQQLAFAPSVTAGDTTYETVHVIFGATPSNTAPNFLPVMTKAQVDVPAARQLTGKPAFCDIEYRHDYVNTPGNTVIGNLGEVFANVTSTTPVEFSSDQTGGMVSPNFSITGLSRGAGPVGGTVANFAAGNFNPADIFKNVKLFGGVNLGEIIQTGVNLIPTAPDIPKLKTIRTKEVIGGVSKDVFQTSYRWDLNAAGLVNQWILTPPGMFGRANNARFLIEAVTSVPLDGSPATSKVHGLIENFTIRLMPNQPLVELEFTKAEFTTQRNAKTDFAIIFKKFNFVGQLSFVNDLLEVIPLDGFNDPPFLRLSTDPPGVEVGFTQGVPTIGVGIFTLQNISFGASFYLPFLDGAALMRFAFCERHQPFTLTVSLFGGGGFFAIEIGLDGVKKVEASLEFGASIALDLGVASGSACIMGGVYYQGGGKDCVLIGYFRAAGCLTVLGFISVSIELYVALGYASKGSSHKFAGHAWGQASVSVKVKIAFFSVSVSISIEREFAGSDPKFIESVSAPQWIEYCNAFADCPV